MQTYKMTLFNAHIEPFYNVELPKMHKHVTSESWETEDVNVVYEWLHDELQSPIDSLTAEEVHRQFDDERLTPLSEEKVQKILEFYTGRAKLLNRITKDLKKVNGPCVLHYDILPEHNTFLAYGEDDGSKQLEAYIEIEVA